MKILLLTISAVALALVIPPQGAGATDIHDQPVQTDVFLPDPGIYQPGPAYDTTFVASYTFDNGPACIESGWTVVDLTADAAVPFGGFGALYPGLALVQQDLCATHFDCVWGFFDGSPDHYTCGGFPLQLSVPKGSETAGYIRNEIWSPAIDWTGAGSEAILLTDVYRDLPLDNLVFYTWRVRSIAGGESGEWRSRDTYYYAPGPDWLRTSFAFGDLVEPGAEQIQVALGVVDMYGAWAGLLGTGACHSHAPLFARVEIVRVDSGGPRWFVHPVDLFQDNFAGDGTTTGIVRMDAARDILPRTSAGIRPGDSVSVWVAEPEYGLDDHQSGAASSGPAVYLHVRDVSPEKSGGAITGDASRWPVVSATDGWTVLRFDSVRAPDGETPEDRYCVDLNDNLFTPGDTVWFFFSARDKSGRTSYWSEYAPSPASTWSSSLEDHAMEVTCLPTGGRRTLYVDDADNRGAQPYLDAALSQLGMLDEVDRYDVRGASYLAGNGPGSRVTNVEDQLTWSYYTIIWNCGSLSAGLIGDGSGRPEKSPDAQMLVEFLKGHRFMKSVYISGDDVAEEWARLHSLPINILKSFMDHTLVAGDHRDRVGINPLVVGEVCSPFEDGWGLDTLVAYGGCPQIADFDVIQPAGAAELGMSYHGQGNTAGAIVYQQTTTDYGEYARAVFSGIGFHHMRDARPQTPSQTAEHLKRIFMFARFSIQYPTREPQLGASAIGTGVWLRWSAEERCGPYTGVTLYRRMATDSSWTPLHTGGSLPQVGEYLDAGVHAGQLYVYRIGASQPDGSEVYSAERAVRVRVKFRRFTATALDAGVELKWAVEWSDTVRAYRLGRRDPGEEHFTWAEGLGFLPRTTSRYVDKTVIPGHPYEYKVSAMLGDYDVIVGYDSKIVRVTAPGAVGLAQNVPNPFNPATTIAYNLIDFTYTRIRVYDVKGRLVRRLVEDTRPPGYNETTWDGLTEAGQPAASGVYFCRMEAQGKVLSRKMLLLR